MYDKWADLITVSTYSCNIACTEELDVAFVDLIVAFTQIGNNFVYLHGLHFPASFLYMYQI